MNDYRQIFEAVNIGLIVLDRELQVTRWNRWMEHYSGIALEDAMGRSIFLIYPDLKKDAFNRSVNSVLTFGSYATFSQKLHKYLFPMKNPHSCSDMLPLMQQHCTMGPVRDTDGSIAAVFVTIQDVTEFVIYERKLLEMAKIDALTGIFNRRYLDQRLGQELERCRRYECDMSIVMLDIDYFKKLNDTYGHLNGDNALRHLSGILRTSVRESDLVARYGGEEFICILTETDLEHACIFTERLRKTVEATPWSGNDIQISMTVSLGIAAYQKNDTLDTIVNRADEALYTAKRNGRNRFEVMEVTAPA